MGAHRRAARALCSWPRLIARTRRAAFFLGGMPTLKHKEVVTSSVDRYRLKTETTGEVHLRLSVLTKDFAQYGVCS